MKAIKPHYYDRFSCKAGGCKNTCCAGWSITVTKEEYFRIKKAPLSSHFAKGRDKYLRRLRKSQNPLEYGMFHMDENGRCPLCNDLGMCQLQLECGENALSEVCKTFPRQNIRVDNVACQHLSLACEAVVELLMEETEGIAYVSEDNFVLSNKLWNSVIDQQQMKRRKLYNYIFDMKVLGMAVLQYRKIPLDERVLFLGMCMKHVDQLEKEKREEEIPAYVDSILSTLDTDEPQKLWKDVQGSKKIQALNGAAILFDFYGSHRRDPFALGRINAKLGITHKTSEEKNVMEYECDLEKYKEAVEDLHEFLHGREYLMENVMLTWYCTMEEPFHYSDISVWENYLGYAVLYQLIKMMLRGTLFKDSSDEDFIQAIVNASRIMVHDENCLKRQIEYAVQRGTTLAHLAVSIKDE